MYSRHDCTLPRRALVAEGDQGHRALDAFDRADADFERARELGGLVGEWCAPGPLQAVDDLSRVGIHEHECPRSRASTRKLAWRMLELGQPRCLWTFGDQVVFVPGKGNQITHNPGVPYVKPPKPWYAGGKPRNLKKKEKAFLDRMRATQEKLQRRQGREYEES